jgi:peptidoglycan/xylan/chitin deacetylase (PgdA/CDA1 family)
MLVVNYHYVRPSFEEGARGIHGLTPGELEAQLTRLARVLSFVGASDVRDAARGNQPLPRRSVLVTFDDGLAEQWEHALPVLSRLGIPALFFVNTAPIAEARVSTVHKIHLLRAALAPEAFHDLLGRQAALQGLQWDPPVARGEAASQYPYDAPAVAALKYTLNCVLAPAQAALLVDACFDEVIEEPESAISRRLYLSVTQMMRLDEMGCLGSHAHEHFPLGLLPREAAERQVREASRRIECWTGRRPFALSYPYGSKESCPADADDLLRREGVEIAFTMERARITNLRRPWHLPRVDCKDLPDRAAALEQWYDRLPAARWFQESLVAS